jgi:hypothetical protein
MKIIGRGRYASETYPEPRDSSALNTFARNFARGPEGSPATGVQLLWNSIDVGIDPDEDVPITARSTGILVISGAIGISNNSGAAIIMTVRVQIDDSSIGSSFRATVPDASFASIPFLVETTPLDTPVGETHNIQVLVQGDGASTPADESSISIQEVSVATG